MLTEVGAEEKETGLIVDKLYQVLKEVSSLLVDCLDPNDYARFEAPLKEFEEKYGGNHED